MTAFVAGCRHTARVPDLKQRSAAPTGLGDDTLDGAALQRAVEATFARRQAALPRANPIGRSDAFAEDTTQQTPCRAFLNKNKREPMDLRDVIGAIRAGNTQFGLLRQ